MKKTKIYIIVIALILLLIAGFYVVTNRDKRPSAEIDPSQNLNPVSSITHGHGLNVDVQNPENVYIATHHGLLLLKNDKDLFQIGESGDDYMGFSAHPTDSKIFFSSGHPKSGGNIGFQKSIDGGSSWEKLSDGVNGPVDFHALTVSPINPDLIFGWYQGAVQRTVDGGKNWQIVSRTATPFVNLAADPKDENIVYASTPQGLLISTDKGGQWTKILDGFVSVAVVNSQDSQKLLAYTEQQLVRSNDGGKTWEKTNTDFSAETPLYISFAKQQPDIGYLLTEKNSIYKSTDGAISWKKIR